MIAIIYFILALFILIGWVRYIFEFLFTSKYAIIGWLLIIFAVIRMIWFPQVCHICLDGGYIYGK